MKKILLLLILLQAFILSHAQLCPGAGTNFSTATFFNPSWISGCATGTSCSGGTVFDNRVACEPTTAIEACAPAPTCASAADAGSDLWFKFYAAGTTATISVIQSVSFIATIQVFSGTTCASLTQIGCALAGGPSSGVTLNLTGLTKNALYYFRVFGTSNTASQRTGTFCFCGTTGLSNIILPLRLLSFTGKSENGAAYLKWVSTEQRGVSHFEIQKSNDGTLFTTIGTRNILNQSTGNQEYFYIDNNLAEETGYYRLKIVDEDGTFNYSSIIKITHVPINTAFTAYFDNTNHQLHIQSIQEGRLSVYSSTGSMLTVIDVQKGKNLLYCNWKSGLYLLKNEKGETKKLWIVH